MLSLFFFMIDLYFLIPAVIVETFIPTAEFLIHTVTRAYEANAYIETPL